MEGGLYNGLDITKPVEEDPWVMGVVDFRIKGGGPWGDDMPGPRPVAEQSD